jgi:hypothetical protein
MFRNTQGDKVEIIIRDCSGAKIESYKFNISDKNLGDKILAVIKSKYGFKQDDSDIDWLRKTEW